MDRMGRAFAYYAVMLRCRGVAPSLGLNRKRSGQLLSPLVAIDMHTYISRARGHFLRVNLKMDLAQRRSDAASGKRGAGVAYRESNMAHR